MADNRRLLALLETAYTAARYGDTEYDWETVDQAFHVVEGLLRLLDGVTRRVKMG